MRNDWLITFRSITFAQKGERMLQKAGIGCSLQRTPKVLSERGCGYCLRVHRENAFAAVGVIKENGLPYGKVYKPGENGYPEEWHI